MPSLVCWGSVDWEITSSLGGVRVRPGPPAARVLEGTGLAGLRDGVCVRGHAAVGLAAREPASGASPVSSRTSDSAATTLRVIGRAGGGEHGEHRTEAPQERS